MTSNTVSIIHAPGQTTSKWFPALCSRWTQEELVLLVASPRCSGRAKRAGMCAAR